MQFIILSYMGMSVSRRDTATCGRSFLPRTHYFPCLPPSDGDKAGVLAVALVTFIGKITRSDSSAPQVTLPAQTDTGINTMASPMAQHPRTSISPSPLKGQDPRSRSCCRQACAWAGPRRACRRSRVRAHRSAARSRTFAQNATATLRRASADGD
ncbi:hypothetical protein B0H21DRAFT_542520 [Amylocystis lapponica]|nr:hypothetical protein B0H21DRAFT_542520 [Amylocystis lapponica]